MANKAPAKRGRSKRDGYLVATFEKFPGVRMPLLSDEECRARGLKPVRLPPVVTWTKEQREALDELAELFAEVAVRKVLAEREVGAITQSDPTSRRPAKRRAPAKARSRRE